MLNALAPQLVSVGGRRVAAIGRMGKRIVIALEGDLFLVLHLMRAGRLRWFDSNKKPAKKSALAVFEFATGHLVFTEAGTKRRAALHLLRGEAALQTLDPGGLEVLESDLATFAARLTSERLILKRALTAPALFGGIGGAYSDESLFRAQLAQLTPCTLSEDDLAILRDKLGALNGLKRVWICQKEVEHLVENPVYVVAFEVAGWRKKEQVWFKTLGEVLPWPADTFFVMKGGAAKKLANKVIVVGTQLR